MRYLMLMSRACQRGLPLREGTQTIALRETPMVGSLGCPGKKVLERTSRTWAEVTGFGRGTRPRYRWEEGVTLIGCLHKSYLEGRSWGGGG